MKASIPVLLLCLAKETLIAGVFTGISEKPAIDSLHKMSEAFDRGNCQAVADLSEKLFKEKPSSSLRSEAYSYQGRCYEAQGLPDKAISVYKLAHAVYPEDDFFLQRLAGIYLENGFYLNAIPLYDKALKRRSDDPAVNAGLAKCYASMGFLAKAKKFYSRAAALTGLGDAALLKEYAFWMVKKRDWAELEVLTSYGANLVPLEVWPYELSARAAAAKGDYRGAILQIKKALKLAPADKTLKLESAVLNLLSGEFDKVLAELKNSSGEASVLVKGMALEKKGDLSGAALCYKEASLSADKFVAQFASVLLKNK